MSTTWSTARRRAALAFAPAAIAALAFAGTAAADPTCLVPGESAALGGAAIPACLPNLAIEKTGPPTVGPGTVTWTIRVIHRGFPDSAGYGYGYGYGGTAGGIRVSDIRVDDPNLGLTDLTPDAMPEGGLLLPGESVAYTVVQTFDERRCFKHQIENTARFTLDGIEQTTTEDDTVTAYARVVCTADVGVVKTADKAAYLPGETIAWTVNVTNTGTTDIPVSRIRVDDPAATLVPPTTAPGARLQPGQRLTFTATTPVTIQNCGTIANTATVTLTGTGPADANPQNNSSTATVTCTPPSPTENPPGGSTGTPGTPGTPAAPGGSTSTPTNVCPRVTVNVGINAAKRPFAGQLSTVVISVRARTAAQKVRLTYRLPSSFAVVSRTPGATLRRGILVADLGNLAAGRTKTVRLSVRILRTAKGKRQHTATVTATCAATARTALAANVRPLQGSVQPAVTG